ncbi:MAG: hypothetical protein ACOC35_07180 [Promethearchaeia archaeon]
MSATKPLVLQEKAFLKMIEWMGKFANFTTIPQGSWVEAMGVMFCRDTANKYIIVDAEGITSGNLVYVETSPQQVAKITQIEAQLQKKDSGVYAGGWFHSHPGHSLFYSGTDLSNQAYWQTGNPNGVGLVFDLTKVTDNFIGFKFFRLDAPQAQTYHEVPYELHGFTEETLMKAFKPIGIDVKTIHRLARNLGLKSKEGIVEFEKIKLPETDDPVKAGKKAAQKAKNAYLTGKIPTALKNYRIANMLLKKTAEGELYLDSTVSLAELCIFYDYPETAHELIKEILLYSKKMDLRPDYYEGKTELLKAYFHELKGNDEKARSQYQKAYEIFKSKKMFYEAFQGAELAGGISWKLDLPNEALPLFKDALYNLTMAEQKNGKKHEEIIWETIRKRVSSKIKDIEQGLGEQGIEKV